MFKIFDSVSRAEPGYQEHVGPEHNICHKAEWVEERKEKGAKSLFLRVWVGTQKIPIILKKITYFQC